MLRLRVEAGLTSLASGQGGHEIRQDLFSRHRSHASRICIALQSLFDAKEACAIVSKGEQTAEDKEVLHKVCVL
jgi:hypothetical protein